MLYNVKFRCPNRPCQGTVLDERVTGVIQDSQIRQVEPLGECVAIEYGTIATDGGEVSGYACSECGFQLRDEHGKNVTTDLGLLEWLNSHEMLEPIDGRSGN